MGMLTIAFDLRITGILFKNRSYAFEVYADFEPMFDVSWL